MVLLAGPILHDMPASGGNRSAVEHAGQRETPEPFGLARPSQWTAGKLRGPVPAGIPSRHLGRQCPLAPLGGRHLACPIRCWQLDHLLSMRDFTIHAQAAIDKGFTDTHIHQQSVSP